MPKVAGKEFPYSPAGKKAAQEERMKQMSKGKLPGFEKMPRSKMKKGMK